MAREIPIPKEAQEQIRRQRERLAEQKEALKEKRDSNAEFQRRCQMTADERSRDAFERTVAKRKEFNDFREGRDTTQDRAEREMREILQKSGK